MRYFILIFFLYIQVFAHGFIQQSKSNNTKVLQERYGAFLDLQYRNKNIYENGYLGSHGYELHGEEKEAQLQHLGLFYSFAYQNFTGAIEANSHNGSDNSLNETIERAFIGYNIPNFSLRLGRAAYAISLVEIRAYGYDFIKMPIALNSFFSGNYYGDGISMNFYTEHFNLQVDALADMYSNYGKYSAKLSYTNHINHNDIQLYAYFHKQPKVINKFSSTAHKDKHSHSSSCSLLETGELCFDGSRDVYGTGFSLNNHHINLLTEVLYNNEEGNIRSSTQQISEQSKQYSAFTQIIIPISKFNIGYRYEYFWFDNQYNGLGAEDIKNTIFQNSLAINNEYLGTALLSYTYKSHNFRIEYQHSKKENSIGFQYLFIFDSQR